MVAYLDKLQQPNGLFLPRSGVHLSGDAGMAGRGREWRDAERSAGEPSAAARVLKATD